MSRPKKAGRWSTLGSMDALAIRGAAYELEIIDKEQTPHMRYMRKWRRKGIRICSPHTISARLPCDEVQIVCSGCPGLEMRDGIEPSVCCTAAKTTSGQNSKPSIPLAGRFPQHEMHRPGVIHTRRPLAGRFPQHDLHTRLAPLGKWVVRWDC
jgi:hypothetical protein